MTDTCQQCGVSLNAAGFCINTACPAYEEARLVRGNDAEAHSTYAVKDPDNAISGFDDAQLSRLRDLQARRSRGELKFEFVTICGFPTAGKTWLTPRLKSDLISRREWSVEMDERDADDNEVDRLAGVKSMGQTEDLLIHSFAPKHRRPGTPIKLIDIPGEYFKRLIESRDEADLPHALLAALAVSDRIILTLPSDVCVIGSLIHRDINAEPDQRKRKTRVNEILQRDTTKLQIDREHLAENLRAMRDEGRLESNEYKESFETFRTVSVHLSESLIVEQWSRLALFADKIRRVMGRASHLAYGIGRDKFFELPPERWQEGYSSQIDHRPVPLTAGSYAVLTKADRVLPLLTDRDFGLTPCAEWEFLPERDANLQALDDSGWRDQLAPHIGDPRLLLSMTMPELVSQLDGWLPNMRYEWASADWQAGDWSIDMDVSHQCSGITQLTDWLCDGAPVMRAPSRSVTSIARMRALVEGRHIKGAELP